jgi:hypothetical protein
MGASSLQTVDYPNFPYCYRAKVLDNADPEMKGRIKVQVYPMFATLEVADIDWSQAARPAFPLSSGAGDGYGTFAVPAIGSFVFVFFEAGDFNQCVYFAEAATATKGLPSQRTVNYPHRYVLVTPYGIGLRVDNTAGDIQIFHPAGTTVTIDNTGKVLVDSANIQLGASLNPLDIDALVKVTDLLLSKIVITAPSGGGPCVVTNPGGFGGTTKVKGV